MCVLPASAAKSWNTNTQLRRSARALYWFALIQLKVAPNLIKNYESRGCSFSARTNYCAPMRQFICYDQCSTCESYNFICGFARTQHFGLRWLVAKLEQPDVIHLLLLYFRPATRKNQIAENEQIIYNNFYENCHAAFVSLASFMCRNRILEFGVHRDV